MLFCLKYHRDLLSYLIRQMRNCLETLLIRTRKVDEDNEELTALKDLEATKVTQETPEETERQDPEDHLAPRDPQARSVLLDRKDRKALPDRQDLQADSLAPKNRLYRTGQHTTPVEEDPPSKKKSRRPIFPDSMDHKRPLWLG